MNSPEYILDNGLRIKTHPHLQSTGGMLVLPDYLENRVPDTEGVISGVVGGHGGDVYWVTHGEKVAVYCWSEFELVPTSVWDLIKDED